MTWNSGLLDGWRRKPSMPSLPESHRTVGVSGLRGLKRFLAFAGPGYLVAVGYMDPGNWATDLAGGSQFGYLLLAVILLSNFAAMFLQSLCAKLGIVAGRDLAQACHDQYSPWVSKVLWVLCELAITACDLAELLGSAIALKLLFGIPLVWGVVLTAADVLVVLLLQGRKFRVLEGLVTLLVLGVGACFALVVFWAHPDWAAVARGFVPSPEIVSNPTALYIAIGILGATVMPHNLYLHSSIVQTRAVGEDEPAKREALKFATWDSNIALLLALFVNAGILIVSAAAFHGRHEVTEIDQAYKLLAPVLGVTAASTLFAVALLASGQNATITGTLAGQIVMEGFLDLRIPGWARRLITRVVAIVPTVFIIGVYGEGKAMDLLVFSQVVLSLQLPFAIVPLLKFTGDKKLMGPFVNKPLTKVVGWTVATVIIALNVYLLYNTVSGWVKPAPTVATTQRLAA
ncbi:MAG: Nramp family divalent metal transporter [Fimbriimonadaceae bacterium]|nr:Nramp family divalent metal transporter [Fimbriimonadaceae bacterium]